MFVQMIRIEQIERDTILKRQKLVWEQNVLVTKIQRKV